MTITATLNHVKTTAINGLKVGHELTMMQYEATYGEQAEYVYAMDIMQSINGFIYLAKDIKAGKSKKVILRNQLWLSAIVLAHNTAHMKGVYPVIAKALKSK